MAGSIALGARAKHSGRVGYLIAFNRGRSAEPSDALGLETLLERRIREACDKLGMSDLSEPLLERFSERCGTLVPAEAELTNWLSAFHLTDFLLAFLVAEAEPRALRLLNDEFILPAAKRSSMGEPPDEVAAATLSHLLVSESDRPARILTYSARGPLHAWIHMVAKRNAIQLTRKVVRYRSDAEEFLENSPLLADPELDLLKFRYAKKFNEALEQALRELPATEANLLYLTGVKRVSLASAATMQQVSVRTVQRRIIAIREKVFEQTREIARAKLDATEEEMSSLLALVQSQLDVTLHRVLCPPES